MAKSKKRSLHHQVGTKLKFLAVIRHGEYDGDHNLSSEGRMQVQRLAQQLTSLVNGGKILLLSSTAKRASQSAAVISTALGVPSEEHAILWSDNSHREDFPGLLTLVRARMAEAEVMMLVTHLEYVESFPAYFAREELGMDMTEAQPPTPHKGEACIVDCSRKGFSLLR